MSEKTKLRICALGGKATAKKLGRAHMSRIGKRGRAKRARNERKAKRILIVAGPTFAKSNQ